MTERGSEEKFNTGIGNSKCRIRYLLDYLLVTTSSSFEYTFGLEFSDYFFWFVCHFSTYEYVYCILICLYYSCKNHVNLYPAYFSVVTISKSCFSCMLCLCHLFLTDISGYPLSSRENFLLLLCTSIAYLMLSTEHTHSHSSVTQRNKFII